MIRRTEFKPLSAVWYALAAAFMTVLLLLSAACSQNEVPDEGVRDKNAGYSDAANSGGEESAAASPGSAGDAGAMETASNGTGGETMVSGTETAGNRDTEDAAEPGAGSGDGAGSSIDSQPEDSGSSDAGNGGKTPAAEPEYLVIPVSELSGTIRVYPASVNGTEMEIIAVQDSGGNVRTAFNTCRICYDSGRGYYEQQGSDLVCQNCGNRFPIDLIGTETGGCNPYPIPEADLISADGSILISYDFLEASRVLFLNWKTEY